MFSTAVYPWYMTFLFAIAGMSCKYAFLKRTIFDLNKQIGAVHCLFYVWNVSVGGLKRLHRITRVLPVD